MDQIKQQHVLKCNFYSCNMYSMVLLERGIMVSFLLLRGWPEEEVRHTQEVTSLKQQWCYCIIPDCKCHPYHKSYTLTHSIFFYSWILYKSVSKISMILILLGVFPQNSNTLLLCIGPKFRAIKYIIEMLL